MESKTNQQKIGEVLSSCYRWHYRIEKEQLNQLKPNRLAAIAELFSSAKSDQHLYDKFWNKNSPMTLHCSYDGTCQFVNAEEEKGLGCFIVSENQINVSYILYESFNLDQEAVPIIHSVVFERNDNKNFITLGIMKLNGYERFRNNFNYLWHSGPAISEKFEKITSKRRDTIIELCSNGVANEILNDTRFWSKSSEVVVDFRHNGACQFVNAQKEEALGYYTISGNLITVNYIFYESAEMDKEGDEPAIHSIVFERNPDNKNYVTLGEIKLYAFEKLLEGLSSSEINYNSPLAQHTMDLVTEAKSNTHSEIWNLYEYYELAPENSKTISLRFREDGHVTGRVVNIDGEARGDIFGIYDVVGSEIKVKYFYLNSFVITRTIDLIDLNPKGKDAISVPSLQGIILCPFKSLYLPLWNNYNSPRAEYESDIKLTSLLARAMKPHYSKSKVFRSDDIKYENESFSRMCHTVTFFPNGTFLRESFTKTEQGEHKYATFGIFFLKEEGQILTEFYDLKERKILEEQVILVISDTQIKIGDLILTENYGKVEFSEKLSAILKMTWKIQREITYEKLSIIELLVQRAEETNIRKSFLSSGRDDWDVVDRNVDFYPNGTCKLRFYSAGHDYENESIFIGNYSVNNGNEFTLRICRVGEMIPQILVLTVDDSITWNGATLNSVNL